MRALIIGLVACGHSDAPPQNHSHEDAPYNRSIPTPSPDAPKLVQIVNVAGEPPASMVVVSSEPKFYIDRTEDVSGSML